MNANIHFNFRFYGSFNSCHFSCLNHITLMIILITQAEENLDAHDFIGLDHTHIQSHTRSTSQSLKLTQTYCLTDRLPKLYWHMHIYTTFHFNPVWENHQTIAVVVAEHPDQHRRDCIPVAPPSPQRPPIFPYIALYRKLSANNEARTEITYSINRVRSRIPKY